MLRRTSGEPLSNFDREQYVTFEVLINGTEVIDTCTQGIRPRPSGALPQFVADNCNRFSVVRTIVVDVIDVNDVLVDKIEYVGDLDRTERDRFTLATSGNDLIQITGLNFGTIRSSSSSSDTSANLLGEFDVRYNTIRMESTTEGGSASIEAKSYVATSCQRLSTTDNTVLQCRTAPGYGRRHRWYVFVGATHRSASGKHRSISTSTLVALSSYQPPLITGITLSRSDGMLDTAGGTVLTISGHALGTTSEWEKTKDTPVTTDQYQFFGEATLTAVSGSSSNNGGTDSSMFKIIPINQHTGMSSRCALPSALARFLQTTDSKTLILQSDVQSNVVSDTGTPLPASTYYVDVSQTLPSLDVACYTQQRWTHRGCWKYEEASASSSSSTMGTESTTDRKFIDRDESSNGGNELFDIHSKCANAAASGGRRHFAIYNGDICKYGLDLEPNFFHAGKILKSISSDECTTIGSQRVDIYELHDLGENEKERRSAMMEVYVTQIMATGTEAVTNMIKDSGIRKWSVYGRATGIADLSNIGVEPGSLDGNRLTPGSFQRVSGRQYMMSCGVTIAHTEMECVVPAGVGSDMLAFLTFGGQMSNGFLLSGYLTPVVTSVTSPASLGQTMPTVGNTVVRVVGTHLVAVAATGAAGTGTGTGSKQFSGSVVYRASIGQGGHNPTLNTKELIAKDCEIDGDGTTITCKTSAGFGKSLEWSVRRGDEQISTCSDVNNMGGTLEERSKFCSGNCMLWCDKCLDVSFFNLHPDPGGSGCPSDTSKFDRGDWDPTNSGTSTPEYLSKGCWRTWAVGSAGDTNPIPLNDAYKISVEINPSDTTLTTVKNVCARISRRKTWWGFSLRGCVLVGSSEIMCECAPVTDTPRVTSYYTFGSDSRCNTMTPSGGSISVGGLGGTIKNGARSVYSLITSTTTTTTVLGTRQRSVWTSSSLGYATPIITSVSGANNSPTLGGNTVTLRGTDMGPANAGFVGKRYMKLQLFIKKIYIFFFLILFESRTFENELLTL